MLVDRVCSTTFWPLSPTKGHKVVPPSNTTTLVRRYRTPIKRKMWAQCHAWPRNTHNLDVILLHACISFITSWQWWSLQRTIYLLRKWGRIGWENILRRSSTAFISHLVPTIRGSMWNSTQNSNLLDRPNPLVSTQSRCICIEYVKKRCSCKEWSLSSDRSFYMKSTFCSESSGSYLWMPSWFRCVKRIELQPWNVPSFLCCFFIDLDMLNVHNVELLS